MTHRVITEGNHMNKPTIGFTREHLKYLEKVFPEITDTTDTNTLLVNTGKRAVVKHIEYLVENGKKVVFDD